MAVFNVIIKIFLVKTVGFYIEVAATGFCIIVIVGFCHIEFMTSTVPSVICGVNESSTFRSIGSTCVHTEVTDRRALTGENPAIPRCGNHIAHLDGGDTSPIPAICKSAGGSASRCICERNGCSINVKGCCSKDHLSFRTVEVLDSCNLFGCVTVPCEHLYWEILKRCDVIRISLLVILYF